MPSENVDFNTQYLPNNRIFGDAQTDFFGAKYTYL